MDALRRSAENLVELGALSLAQTRPDAKSLQSGQHVGQKLALPLVCKPGGQGLAYAYDKVL
jgi:hypothetical protein